MMDDLELECRRCGGVQRQEMVDVSALSGGQDFLPGQWFPCDRCGYTGAPMEPARPHRYRPTALHTMVPWCSGGLDIREIYCGPPAPYPEVPTPEEIRRHALG